MQDWFIPDHSIWNKFTKDVCIVVQYISGELRDYFSNGTIRVNFSYMQMQILQYVWKYVQTKKCFTEMLRLRVGTGINTSLIIINNNNIVWIGLGAYILNSFSLDLSSYMLT